MKAGFENHCHLCDNGWYKGDQIERLCGSWVHAGCKAQELARRRSGASTTVLAPVDADMVRLHLPRRAMRPGVGNTRGIKPLA